MTIAERALQLTAFIISTAIPILGSDALSMGAPALGYDVRPAPPELRRIVGVPGAAVSAGPVPLPPDIRRLTVAPGQDFGLVEGPSSGPALLMLDDGARGPVVPIAGAARTVDFVRFSPGGRAVVLVSRTAGRFQVASNLPGQAEVRWELDLEALPEYPVDAAVSDEGGMVLIASERAVYRLLPDGTAKLVLSLTGAASLAFLPDSATAAIGDRGSGCVWLLDGAPGGSNLSMLANGLFGLHHMAATQDGHTLYVTDRERPRLWSVSAVGGFVEEIALPALAERMDLLRTTDTYLISATPGEPSWILFRKDGRSATVFVPGEQDRVSHPGDAKEWRRDGR